MIELRAMPLFLEKQSNFDGTEFLIKGAPSRDGEYRSKMHILQFRETPSGLGANIAGEWQTVRVE